MSIPEVQARAEHVWSGFHNKGYIWLLKITCPHCGKEHTHGGGSGPEPTVYGERVGHCASSNPGYILVPEHPLIQKL